MSYVPPHKRHSNDAVRPSPVPGSVLPKFKKNLSLTAHGSSNNKNQLIFYAEDFMSRWFLVGSNGTEGRIPQSVQLAPVSIESAELRAVEKPLVLVNNDTGKALENNEVGATELRTPWVSVAEKVEDDLLLAFERVKNGIEHDALEVVKPRLVARFGKILLLGHPSMSLESLKDGLLAESTLRKSKKTFYTNVPSSYMEHIKYGAVPKIGLHVEEDQDRYHVRLSDKSRPDAIISCKCTVTEDKRLNMYKAELNVRRHLVVDVSCLDQNLDVRLMVDSKRLLTALADAEITSMKELLDSAVMDPNVKGGLRWPFGKASSGDRYRVCGVWHTVTTSYGSPTLRLKIREADRFDFNTGIGAATREVTLILKGIAAQLQEQKVDKNSVSDMLKDVLRTIWDNFLSSDPFLT